MVGILGLVLLTQTPAQVAAHPAKLSVRAWLPDTVLPVGAAARVYVELEDSGYLALLHVEPSGRIRVLYPVHPNDPDYLPGGSAFVVGGLSDSTTFRVAAPGIGTVLAVRSWTPLRFTDLATGNRWDYERSLLLQPTAGNPFAALLDIADRIADGEAYTYDLTGYRTPGAGLAVRRTTTDSVCGNCFTAHHQHADPAPADGVASAIAIDHSMAASGNGSVVDCSYATLTSSFCGVDNSVTTYQESTAVAPAPAAAMTYTYPYYPQGYFPFLFFHHRRAPPPPPPPAIALPLRPAPRSAVPPPPRRIPRIAVTQPTAPSHPAAAAAAADPVPLTGVAPAAVVRRFALAPPAGSAAGGSAATRSGGWTRAPAGPRTTMAAPAAVAPAARGSATVAAATPARAAVPSHAAVERARGH